MSNAIVQQHSAVLNRIGAPEERQYLVQVMAEQLGIPGNETGRADVIAVIATAAQRNIEYGWVPGVHMHVQAYYSEKEQQTKYTLVDGEKAWKDSAARWKYVHGVQWRLQRRVMTREELIKEIRLMGFEPPKAARNSFGIWCRVIILGEDDPGDPDDPMWVAGLWFGSIKVGNSWREDRLPTGASSRFVATRRGDKQALMQSHLTLIPLDDRSQEDRASELTNKLRVEYNRTNPIPPNTRKVEREPDGNIIFPDMDGLQHDEGEVEDIEEGQFSEIGDDGGWGDLDDYVHLLHGDFSLPEDTFRWIMDWREAMQDGEIIHAKTYGKLCRLVDQKIGDGARVHPPVLSCLAGARVSRDNRPGKALADLVPSLESDEEDKHIQHLRIILALCEMQAETQSSKEDES